MKKVGIVGQRGMVGSVLMERMRAEKDFAHFEPLFYSTSQVGATAEVGFDAPVLKDAHDLNELKKMDIILTCQGGDYTNKIYPELIKNGWKGYWIDAASSLRMKDDAIIILDPVNRTVIDEGIKKGIKTFVGGNCTVSLMLIALDGLFKRGHIEWLSTMTYQAASGAGAKNMRELVAQMKFLGDRAGHFLADPASAILDLDRQISGALYDPQYPKDNFTVPLAGSLIPWIDSELENGQSREEWKGMVETNKILGIIPHKSIPVDGLCIRVGAMRCHSQALTIKLNKDVPLDEITQMISSANDWVRVIPNHKAESIKELCPAAVSGKLQVPIGRLRKLAIGPQYLTGLTVGDQLLWGAAEPLRRMLRILLA
ncbi:MAG: aspartate-semialdehyde dehydrogenase [Pseudomonadota bacterium]